MSFNRLLIAKDPYPVGHSEPPTGEQVVVDRKVSGRRVDKLDLGHRDHAQTIHAGIELQGASETIRICTDGVIYPGQASVWIVEYDGPVSIAPPPSLPAIQLSRSGTARRRSWKITVIFPNSDGSFGSPVIWPQESSTTFDHATQLERVELEVVSGTVNDYSGPNDEGVSGPKVYGFITHKATHDTSSGQGSGSYYVGGSSDHRNRSEITISSLETGKFYFSHPQQYHTSTSVNFDSGSLMFHVYDRGLVRMRLQFSDVPGILLGDVTFSKLNEGWNLNKLRVVEIEMYAENIGSTSNLRLIILATATHVFP